MLVLAMANSPALREQLVELMRREPGHIEVLERMGGIDGLFDKLHSDPEKGVDPSGIAERQAQFGKNFLGAPPRRTFWAMWLAAANDRTLIILFFAAILSLGLGIGFPSHEPGEPPGWVEGTAIIGTIVLVTLVSAGNTWNQERQFQVWLCSLQYCLHYKSPEVEPAATRPPNQCDSRCCPWHSSACR